MSDSANAGITQKMKRAIQVAITRDELYGVDVEPVDTITTDLRIRFDPDIFGKPDRLWHPSGAFCYEYDRYSMSLYARKVGPHDNRQFIIGPRSQTPGLAERHKELARKAVCRFMDQVPRDEWPLRMRQNDEELEVSIP